MKVCLFENQSLRILDRAKAQDAYFESVIAINLTSMLVLVALFVQVSNHYYLIAILFFG